VCAGKYVKEEMTVDRERVKERVALKEAREVIQLSTVTKFAREIATIFPGLPLTLEVQTLHRSLHQLMMMMMKVNVVNMPKFADQ
jgi:hypothetical protein